jgi:hypothetical protein
MAIGVMGGTTSWLSGSALGTQLTDLLMCSDIQPGSTPSYQICKILYSSHPLGKKMVDTPIAMAQSQQREITIPLGPEDRIRKAFLDEWDRLKADKRAANGARIARIYGMGAVVLIVEGEDPGAPVDFASLWKKTIGFNVLDPLNTSGSISQLNQDPNSLAFQSNAAVVVSGKLYHSSRTCTMLNEDPLYIAYTSSAYGYSGRSVYQRALFPLKSFVQTMRTDDMITRKSGVIIAKMKQLGSIVDNVMSRIVSGKRELAREAITDDVMSIGSEDSVESMNLQALEGPFKLARSNIIENIASAADMPAKILNAETFAEGFGEGTEDAKNVARYVDGIREDMQPIYDFLDTIVQYRAWNPEFYKTIQRDFPDDYGAMDFNQAFYQWRNSFSATWPSLLIEPESEAIKREDVVFRALIAAAEVFLPIMDPDNRAVVVEWVADNMNERKKLFSSPLLLDIDAFKDYVPPEPAAADGTSGEGTEPKAPRPFSDSLATESVAAFQGAVERLAPRERRKA